MILKIITFIVAGLLGVLLHCFVEMNKINKANNGNFKLGDYLKTERFAIYISIVCVIVAALCIQMVTKLVEAEYYITPGFLFVGYCGQSLLVAALGKAADCVSTLTGHQVKVDGASDDKADGAV